MIGKIRKNGGSLIALWFNINQGALHAAQGIWPPDVEAGPGLETWQHNSAGRTWSRGRKNFFFILYVSSFN